MVNELEGGCRVSDLREGTPIEAGCLLAWPRVGRASGAQDISLRILECVPGVSPGMRNKGSDEVLYVLAGRGTLYLDGHAFAAEPDTGFHVAAGRTLTIANAGGEPLVLASSRCPDPEDHDALLAPCTEPGSRPAPDPPPAAHLADQERQATLDRWYCTLVGERQGSTRVTQFVGAIPPGRAPDHYHLYEEVLCILKGEGNMWAGDTSTPIGPGSCVFLPKKQVHCTENTGTGELVLLGVFYPAGSPAVNYRTA